MAEPSPLKLEIVADEKTFAGIEPEWAALWRRCPRATPFQAPEWGLPWWRAFGNGALHCAALRLRGRLAAFLPAYFLEGRLQLIGIGTGDHFDLLAAPEAQANAASAILNYLAEAGLDAEFQQLPADSPLLAAPVPGELEAECSIQDVCLVIPLRGCDTPARKWRELAPYRRKAAKLGAVHFETANETTFVEAFEALLALHARRWNERGEPGVFATPEASRSLRESAAAFLKAGMLRLHRLRIGGADAAALLGVQRGAHFYSYTCGFDPAFRRICPGHLIVGHAIAEAMREGAETFDFLRGEEPFKREWGAVEQPNWRLALRRKRP